MESGIQGYRCRNCSAALPVTADTIAVGCPYCGELNIIKPELMGKLRIVFPLSEEEVLRRLEESNRNELNNVFQRSNLDWFERVIVPIYIVGIKASLIYNAIVEVYYKKCRRTRENREECWIESINVRVNGVYGPVYNEIPVTARRGVSIYSIRALTGEFIAERPRDQPLNEASIPKGYWRDLLALDVDSKTAISIAVDEFLDEERENVKNFIKREAESRVAMRGRVVTGSRITWLVLTPVDVEARVSDPIAVPLYYAVFKDENGFYRVYMAGWSGKVLVMEKPATKLERGLWFTSGITASGLLGWLASITDPLNPYGLLILVGAIGLAIYVSYYTARKAITPMKTIVKTILSKAPRRPG